MDPIPTTRSVNECEIFMAALEIETPDQRSTFLNQECRGDAALRQRIELLLRHHTQAGEFLETPAVSLQDATGTIEASGVAGPASRPLPHSDRTEVLLEGEQPRLDFLTPSDDPVALGRIGQYTVTNIIGRGGMGIVLKARDASLNRVVAIKVLAPEPAANPTARKRFLREARAAAAVVHQHVVTIHAVAEESPPYLVMEYVDGQSLQDKIDATGPLELKETLRIGAQVASGLVTAHAHGVIHRDIKPSNILLENGVERVRITDFGLARAADDVEITRPGEIAGTPQYMSPEQAQGQPFDARSDLFSFGCVLYALCTGRPPFRAETTIAAIRRVCDDTPRPIREVHAETPEWLTEIIDRLLAKQPEERFQTAQEVADLLGQHLAHLQHPGSVPRPASLPSPLRGEGPGVRGGARRRWVAAALILLTVLTALGVTEATGVTDVAGTVISIVTNKGTLIIEIDDPSVQVSLDGEELKISGAGVEQFKLQPGQYQFTATKNGQPVKQELVTITRGGERVVTVSREAVLQAADRPEAMGQAGAFVVLDRQGVVVRKYDTLAAAVPGASDGDTIEVRGNGPFVTEPNTITRALTIRAGGGFRPFIKLSFEGLKADATLLTAEAPLVMEGLEFQEQGPDARMNARSVLDCWNSLRLANCRFANGADRCVNTLGSSPVCDIRNCEFASLAELPIAVYGHRLLMDNCVLVGRIGFNSWQGRGDSFGAPSNDGILGLTRNSFGLESFDFNFCLGPSVDPINVVRVQASDNVFAGPSVFRITHQSDLIEGARPPAGSTEDILTRLLRWHGERNVFSMRDSFLPIFGFPEPVPTIESMAHWKTFWGTTEAGSIEGVVRFHGGDLVAKVNRAPEDLVPDDFRLRTDSTGYHAGPDGKDLGADIDLVGPGAAYERWKKTPEYQQWLQETGQLKGQAGQTPERQAFVRLGRKEVPEQKYDSLSEAVLAAGEGDTIEVRGNGPFVTEPIVIYSGLSIRAGVGHRPVIRLSRVAAEQAGTLFKTWAPVTLEGLELQRLDAPQVDAWPCLIESFDAPLHVAHCRFMRATRGGSIVSARGSPHGAIHACEFLGPGFAFNWTATETSRLAVEQCIFAGTEIGITLESDESSILFKDVDFRCIGNTFVASWPIVIQIYRRPTELTRAADQEALIRLEASENLFVTTESPIVFRQLRPLRTDNPLTADEGDVFLRNFVSWRGQANVYSPASDFLHFVKGPWPVEGIPRPAKLTTLADWSAFWNSDELNSLVDQPRFRGGNVLMKAVQSPGAITPQDFRLADGSPGEGAGENGNDVGADTDLVGPGAAYDRWKQTPEYQQWLNDTGQMK